MAQDSRLSPSSTIPGSTEIQDYTFGVAGKPAINRRNWLTADRVPGASDDSNAGFLRGSVWIFGSQVFLCVVSDPGSASWTSVSSSGGGGGGGENHYDPTPYDAGTQAGDVTLDRANGISQSVVVDGAFTINPPSSGAQGKVLRLSIFAAGSPRDMDVDDQIAIPSDSSVTFPKTLEANKFYIVQLQHNGSRWMLTSLVGGYE